MKEKYFNAKRKEEAGRCGTEEETDFIYRHFMAVYICSCGKK